MPGRHLGMGGRRVWQGRWIRLWAPSLMPRLGMRRRGLWRSRSPARHCRWLRGHMCVLVDLYLCNSEKGTEAFNLDIASTAWSSHFRGATSVDEGWLFTVGIQSIYGLAGETLNNYLKYLFQLTFSRPSNFLNVCTCVSRCIHTRHLKARQFTRSYEIFSSHIPVPA